MMHNGNSFFVLAEVGLLGGLHQLSLGGSALTGAIPTELALMTELRSLHLPNTQLSGPLPSGLAQLELGSLDVSGNPGMTGTIPEELCGLGRNQSSCVYESFWSVGRHTLSNVSCSLEFDCSNTLCGCGCSCDGNTSISNRT